MRLALSLSLLTLAAPAFAGKKPKPAPAAPAAPAPAADVTVACPFTTGSTYRWRVITEKTGRGAMRTDTFVSIETKAATPELLTFHVGSQQAAAPTGDPLTVAMAEYQSANPITYQITYSLTDGTLTLINPEEVTAWAQGIGQAIAPALKANGMPEEMQAQILGMVTNADFLSASATRSVQPLVQYSCNTFQGGTISYENQMPNPFGGAPLAAVGQLQFTPGTPIIHVDTDDVVSGDTLKALATDLIAKMSGQGAPPEVTAALKDLQGQMSNSLDTDISADTGLVQKYVATSVTSMGPVNAQTTTTGTLVVE